MLSNIYTNILNTLVNLILEHSYNIFFNRAYTISYEGVSESMRKADTFRNGIHLKSLYENKISTIIIKLH